jgi:hypothetical protein
VNLKAQPGQLLLQKLHGGTERSGFFKRALVLRHEQLRPVVEVRQGMNDGGAYR